MNITKKALHLAVDNRILLPDVFFWRDTRLSEEKNILIGGRASLLLETIFVTMAVVWLIKILRTSLNHPKAWVTVPVVLIVAALVPTFFRKRGFAEVGLCANQPLVSLRLVCLTCLIVFPALLGGVFLLKYHGVQLPLRPTIPDGRWLSWLVYQFLYVAVAEEIFFRGYLQGNVSQLLAFAVQNNRAFLSWMSIIVSAAIFAISHYVLLGNMVAIVTFFPALIFGWLFIKTRSLLAPILFHGLANVGYGFIAMALT